MMPPPLLHLRMFPMDFCSSFLLLDNLREENIENSLHFGTGKNSNSQKFIWNLIFLRSNFKSTEKKSIFEIFSERSC